MDAYSILLRTELPPHFGWAIDTTNVKLYCIDQTTPLPLDRHSTAHAMEFQQPIIRMQNRDSEPFQPCASRAMTVRRPAMANASLEV